MMNLMTVMSVVSMTALWRSCLKCDDYVCALYVGLDYRYVYTLYDGLDDCSVCTALHVCLDSGYVCVFCDGFDKSMIALMIVMSVLSHNDLDDSFVWSGHYGLDDRCVFSVPGGSDNGYTCDVYSLNYGLDDGCFCDVHSGGHITSDGSSVTLVPLLEKVTCFFYSIAVFKCNNSIGGHWWV